MAQTPDRPPIPPLIARPASELYRRVIRERNRRFDAGRGVERFAIPVVSVGNLSVGGTGKTPMVAEMVRWIREAGANPCVAMRGYKSRGGRSDEAEELHSLLDPIEIVARADRAAGLRALLGSERGRGIDVIVLDDGFQHRRIARDLDIVLIHAGRDPRRDRLLPAGWLREPVSSLERADAIVVTHAESVSAEALDEMLAWAGSRSGSGVVAACEHVVEELSVYECGHEEVRPISWLVGKRVLPVCAIGSPGPFVKMVRAGVGGETLRAIILRDHDAYGEGTMERIRREGEGADVIVTTGKDWVKIGRRGAASLPAPVAVARLRLSWREGEGALRSAVVRAVHRG